MDYKILFLISIELLTLCSSQMPIHRRFEYKHSFRAPDLAQRDGSIPFWIVTGDAIASNDQLRLAPSLRSRRGLAWNKRPMSESENFLIEVALRITGQSRIGADGLAIWYTAQMGTIGSVFGANDLWTGMGLFLDSFDNDGQKNNPYISLMVNDGTRQYDHQSDGTQQILKGCQKDFRNKPYPVRLKIEYSLNVVTVYVSDGMQPNPRFEICIRSENVYLPKNGFFGLSAATGGLADDHDVFEFSTFSLFTDEQMPKKDGTLAQEEKQKYDAEFEQQMKEYEAEQQKFKQEHPDKVKEEEDYSKYYEDVKQRELRQLYETQNLFYQILQQMETKLNEIGNLQNSHTAMLQNCGSVQSGGSTAGGQIAPNVASGFNQNEKNEALQALRDLTSTIRDMKSYVNEIFTRTYNLEQTLSGRAPSGGGAQAQPDGQLRQTIDAVYADVKQIRAGQIAQATGGAAMCPNVSCLNSTIFAVIVIAQTIILMTVVIFKSRQDKAKFY